MNKMTNGEVQIECDRAIRAVLAEPDPRAQIAMLLTWIVEMGNARNLEIAPPLDKMLGINPPAAVEEGKP